MDNREKEVVKARMEEKEKEEQEREGMVEETGRVGNLHRGITREKRSSRVNA